MEIIMKKITALSITGFKPKKLLTAVLVGIAAVLWTFAAAAADSTAGYIFDASDRQSIAGTWVPDSSGISDTIVAGDGSIVPSGEYAVKIPFGRIGGQGFEIHKRGQLDLDAVMRTGSICFELYAENNIPADGLQVYLKKGINGVYKESEAAAVGEEIAAGRWNNISIPFSSLASYNSFDYGAVNIAVFRMSATVQGDFNVYIKNICIKATDELTASVRYTENNENAVIKWRNGTGKTVKSYTVYKDGKALKAGISAAVLQYTDASAGFDSAVYKVRAAFADNTQKTVTAANAVYHTTSARTVFGHTGFNEKSVKDIAEDAVILRSGCAEGYMNNVRYAIDETEKKAAPFIENGSFYAPIAFVLEGLGYRIEENGDTVLAVKDGGELRFDADGAKYGIIFRNHRLFMPAEELAATVGTGCTVSGEVAVFGDKITSDAAVSEKVKKKILAATEYNKYNAFLGADGFVTGLVIHPKNPDVMYTRTDVGGVYRYDTEREIWIPLLDTVNINETAWQSVAGIALDPNDDNVIWAACGDIWYSAENGLLKSTDRGRTWEIVKTFPGRFDMTKNDLIRLVGEPIAVDPTDGNTVYCGSFDMGFFVTHDGGATWTAASGLEQSPDDCPGGVSAVAVDSSDGAVYVGVFGRGIYKSTDGGATFRYTEGSPKMPARLAIAGGRLYASSYSMSGDSDEKYPGGIFVYENGKWRDISPADIEGDAAAAGDAYCGLLVDSDNTDTVICCGAPYRSNAGRIYRSTDGGKLWSYAGKLTNASCLVQDGKNKKGYYAPWGFGISYIEDIYADTAREIRADTGIEELCVTKILSIPSADAPKLITLNHDMGMKRNDRLDTRANIPTPYFGKGIAADYCNSDMSVVVRAGFVQNSVDGDSVIAISRDYGRNYRQLGSWNKSIPIMDIAVSAGKGSSGNPTILVAAAGSESLRGIYRSEDMGASWTRVSGITVDVKSNWEYTNRRLVSDTVDGSTFYFVNSHRFYISRDGGATWQEKYKFPSAVRSDNNYNGEFVKAAPGRGGCVWFRNANAIYKTEDYGDKWSIVGSIDEPYAFGFGAGRKGADNPAVYAIGTVNGTRGLFVSEDMGVSWTRINDNANGFPCIVSDVCGDSLNYGRVYVGTHGRGVLVWQHKELDDEKPVITPDAWAKNGLALNSEDRFEISGTVSEYCILKNDDGEVIPVDGNNRFSFTDYRDTGKNRYTLSASDAAGNTADNVDISVVYEPKGKTFFGNGSANAEGLGTWAVNYGVTDANAIVPRAKDMTFMKEGTYAVRMSFYDGKNNYGGCGFQVNRLWKNHMDISDMTKNGELYFRIYVDSWIDNAAALFNVHIRNDDSNDWKPSNRVNLPDGIKRCEWTTVRIPLAQLTEGSEFDASKLYNIVFTMSRNVTQKLDIYIQDIGFCNPPRFVGPEVTDADGAAADTVVSGGEYTFSVVCNDEDKAAEGAVCLIGIYEDGALKDAYIADRIEQDGRLCGFTKKITVGSELKQPKYRVFVWNGMSEIKPQELFARY